MWPNVTGHISCLLQRWNHSKMWWMALTFTLLIESGRRLEAPPCCWGRCHSCQKQLEGHLTICKLCLQFLVRARAHTYTHHKGQPPNLQSNCGCFIIYSIIIWNHSDQKQLKLWHSRCQVIQDCIAPLSATWNVIFCVIIDTTWGLKGLKINTLKWKKKKDFCGKKQKLIVV